MKYLMIGFLIGIAGCNLLTNIPDGGVIPIPPVPAPVYSEQDYWDQFAKAVEADVFDNSDNVCLAVDKLVKTGELKDVSRLAEVRKTRIQPISGDAKAKIIFALKGK